MSLAESLTTLKEGFFKTAPQPVLDLITRTTYSFRDTFQGPNFKVGDTLPPFTLTDATGKTVSSADLLSKNALLISFYRGEWCPYCNLELAALQKELPAFTEKGVTLVAISPELPNTSLTIVEKNELKFPVLTDEGCKYAKELGIVVTQLDEMKPFFQSRGVDFKERTGREELEVPVPASILVDKEGKVRELYVDWDYSKRLEPKTALEWVDKL